MKRRNEDQELAERAYLLRSWKAWHREQLEEALAGVHRDVLERLMEQLKQLHNARELVDFISAQNWEAIPADTRLIALHEINQAITKLPEKSGREPNSDPLPGQPDNAFRIIRALFDKFPAPAGRPAGVSGKSME